MTEKELNRLIKKNNELRKKSFKKTVNKNNQINNMKIRHIDQKSKTIMRIRVKKVLIYLIAVCMLFFSIYLYNESLKQVICIDAGHGGHDTGAISNDKSRYEKDDNLKLALLVKENLNNILKEKEYKGKYKVLLTRDSDEYLTLNERCKKANVSNAIIFISLHRNSLPENLGDAKGVEVWINNYENESEIELANDILDEISNTRISENRGIKYGTMNNNGSNYFVNEHTNMKSVIVEFGFISNDFDNQLYDNYISDYANAIAKAIIKNIKNKNEALENVR